MIKTESAFDFFQVLKYQKYIIGINGYIAGGCFKNIFNDEVVKDIDIFFRSKEDFFKAKQKYDDAEDEYRRIYTNKNAVGYLDISNNLKIDLVRSRFGKPKKMIQGFDFTITKFTLYSEITGYDDENEPNWETKVSFHEGFFKHLTLKRLVVDEEMDFPLSTFNRMIRYVGYGYKPCRETKEKIVRKINEVELPSESEGIFKGFYDGVD